MKVEVLCVESSVPSWSKEFAEMYSEKISKFCSFKIRNIKSTNLSRAQKDKKVEIEGKGVLNALKKGDFVVVLDEHGESLSSIEFSKLLKGKSSNKERVVFVVGGAFGLAPDVIARADRKLSLSSFVLSHVVAQSVLLEQIYRAFTIINDIPYHNE